jgi:hypothetical protein
VLGQLQVRIGSQNPLRVVRCALQQLAIPGQLGHPEYGLPVLPDPDQLALTPELEIDLGQPKAVSVAGQGAEASRLLGPKEEA